jgi:hypothetical protein
MSASRHARVIIVQSIRLGDRVANSRHWWPPRFTTATQESREQALNGDVPRSRGSPLNAEASAKRSRT